MLCLHSPRLLRHLTYRAWPSSRLSRAKSMSISLTSQTCQSTLRARASPDSTRRFSARSLYPVAPAVSPLPAPGFRPAGYGSRWFFIRTICTSCSGPSRQESAENMSAILFCCAIYFLFCKGCSWPGNGAYPVGWSWIMGCQLKSRTLQNVAVSTARSAQIGILSGVWWW